MELPGYLLVAEILPETNGACLDWYLAGRPLLAASEIDVLTTSGNWVAVIAASVRRDSVELWWLICGGPVTFTLGLPTTARFRWSTPRPMLRCVIGSDPATPLLAS